MSAPPPTKYTFAQFAPVIGTFVNLPAGCVLHRGYNLTYAPVTEVPAFFGPEDVAVSYSRLPGRALGTFIARRELKLYDVRYLSMLLRGVLEGRATNPPGAETDAIMDIMLSLTISFGLSSLAKQIELIRHRFRNDLAPVLANVQSMEAFYADHCTLPPDLIDKSIHPFEPNGYRVAETTNDGTSLTFLKGFFEGHVDGFIAPRLFSPFHCEKSACMMTQEILLFNPLRSMIEWVADPTTTLSTIIEKPLLDVLQTRNGFVHLSFQGFERKWFQRAGARKGRRKPTNPNAFFEAVDANQPDAKSAYDRVLETAKKYLAAMLQVDPLLFVGAIYRPHPTARVSPWRDDA